MKISTQLLTSILLLFTILSCSEDINETLPQQTANLQGEGIDLSLDEQLSKYKNYTPKPKNIPSKAPKSVICNYYAANKANFGPSGSILATYCGNYYGGTVPAPQSVLDALFAPRLTHNINDIYIINPLHPNGQVPFSSYYSYLFSSIKTEITNFYQKVYIPQLGYSLSVSGNITAAKHVDKQAFIDSFYNWLYAMQNSAPNTFNYLGSNPQVAYQLFNFFADYNLKYSETEGVYLGLAYGEYAQNQDIVCLTLAGEHLLTSAGFALIQQLGSGSLSIEQFRNALSWCN